MNAPACDQAIVADENGVSYGIVEPYRLRCRYQTVFARSGAMLSPIAISSDLVIERAGKQMPVEILDGLTSERKSLCLGVARRLAIRNLADLRLGEFIPDLILRLPADTERPHIEIAILLSAAAEQGVDPSRICFDLSDLTDVHPSISMLVDVGIRFALDAASASALWSDAAQSLIPGLVRVPPSWIRRIVYEADLLRALRLLVKTLQRNGSLVQFEGISNDAQFRAAIAAGADRLQGDFLAPSMRAAKTMDVSPRAFADLIGAHANVVPLSA